MVLFVILMVISMLFWMLVYSDGAFCDSAGHIDAVLDAGSDGVFAILLVRRLLFWMLVVMVLFVILAWVILAWVMLAWVMLVVHD